MSSASLLDGVEMGHIKQPQSCLPICLPNCLPNCAPYKLDLHMKQLDLMPKYQRDDAFKLRVKMLAALALLPLADVVPDNHLPQRWTSFGRLLREQLDWAVCLWSQSPYCVPPPQVERPWPFRRGTHKNYKCTGVLPPHIQLSAFVPSSNRVEATWVPRNTAESQQDEDVQDQQGWTLQSFS